MKLEGKKAIVTGGASGIGKATTLELARAGARVFVGDIDASGGAAVQKEAQSAGLKVDYVKLDLANDASIDQFAAQVLERAGGRVDVLVNAAGWGRVQPFVDNPPEFWDQVLAINLKGPIRLTQKLVPSMFEARSGKIINISSDAGRVGSLGETVYAAATSTASARARPIRRSTTASPKRSARRSSAPSRFAASRSPRKSPMRSCFSRAAALTT
jgi:2-hydroxycyclohexanecarboxyl-CoA dehydrogenase